MEWIVWQVQISRHVRWAVRLVRSGNCVTTNPRERGQMFPGPKSKQCEQQVTEESSHLSLISLSVPTYFPIVTRLLQVPIFPQSYNLPRTCLVGRAVLFSKTSSHNKQYGWIPGFCSKEVTGDTTKLVLSWNKSSVHEYFWKRPQFTLVLENYIFWYLIIWSRWKY